MAEKKLLKMGNPILREIAKPVKNFNTPELYQLIGDMKDTMVANDGAGLAAIQIGILKRVIIFGFKQNPRYPQSPAIPLTVLINPQYTSLDNEIESGWEGCLSVPGMRGLVPRFKKIQYSGYDVLGKKITREVSDFHARVVQHELDHLDGLLYVDKIEDHANFGFIQELELANAY
tara:strand:+ start:48 stop:572 length:525 start_codon:yes stop_codon:yes gene_type:complete